MVVRKKHLLKQIHILRKHTLEEIEEFKSEIEKGIEGNQESNIIHNEGHLAALGYIEKCLEHEKDTIDKKRVRKELRKISRSSTRISNHISKEHYRINSFCMILELKEMSKEDSDKMDFNIGIQCVTNFLRDVINYNKFVK